jgi:hypothetical protein
MRTGHVMRTRLALVLGLLLGPVAGRATPVVDGVVTPAALLPGKSAPVYARAHETTGAPLTYAWTVSAGQLAAAGPDAIFTAPATYGTVTVSLTVANAAGETATASATIQIALSTFQGSLSTVISAQRLSGGPAGELWALDGRTGQVALLTARGEVKGKLGLGERATSVAAGPGFAYVSLASGKLVKVDATTGAVLETVPARASSGAVGMAWDAARGLLWMADRLGNRVRVIRPDGTTAFALTTAGTVALRSPAAVAIDAAGGQVWVALQTNESGNAIFAFTLDGKYVRGAAPFGSSLGKVTRVGGLAVDPGGNVWVTDMFQDQVQVLSRSGVAVSAVGRFGDDVGDLRQPSDVAALANGEMVVASSDRGKLERFGAGAALPACAGDADCDGLPDAWELAHGLDPDWAGDAWLDADGDAASNAQELLAGTDPRRADTDGDGYADGQELATGFSPTDPTDHLPLALVAGAPVTSDPGLVTLSATVTAAVPCTAAWTQLEGPAVTLRGASTLAPSFVARVPGRYRLRGVAVCGLRSSEPVTLEATVRNVPPRPEAGRLVVAAVPGDALLDGAFTTDANGDLVALRWDQVLGPPMSAGGDGITLPLRLDASGLSEFMLTATDARGAEATAQVPVVGVSPGAVVPTAVAPSPLTGRAGVAVVLDATGSYGAETYRWTQASGAPVALDGADGPVASFTPATAGRYAFDLVVGDAVGRSPAARVDVFVAAAEALPSAVATGPARGEPGEPLALDGRGSAAASGGALGYAWRQVAGPAAGLTGADRAVAIVVPFAPGVHVFELQVVEGGAPSLPARVTVEVPPPGGALPVAIAAAPTTAPLGARVVLDGSASTAGGAPRFRWTQVGGPWVPLDDATAPVAVFQPSAPGLYDFELEVVDGDVRSAAARVRVAVLDGGTP